MSTSVFSLRLPEELMEEVKVIAKEEDRSANNMIVYILKAWIEHKKIQTCACKGAPIIMKQHNPDFVNVYSDPCKSKEPITRKC